MESTYLEKSDYNRWNEFVTHSPQSTIYGKTWYLEVLQCPFRILVVKEQGVILGGIVLTKNPLDWYANPYLCKYLGVYFSQFSGNKYIVETKQKRVTERLLLELKQFKTFDYSFHPTFKNYLPFYLKNFSAKVAYSYWIELKHQSIEQIQANMYGKLRSEIKFALKQEYQIDYGIDFDTFYAIQEKTYLRKGGKSPFKKEFLHNYTKALTQKKAFQSFAIQNQAKEVMAIAGVIYDQQATSLVINGFDPKYIQRGANELLIFECIKFAKKHSNSFDFEGSMLKSVDSFYRKFGGEHVPYLKVYKNSILNFVLEKSIYYYRQLKSRIRKR